MEMKYAENAKLFKVLADTTRLMIVDMLSCGEMCACEILERFHITQPTLSYHMKQLCDSDLVEARKDGKWTYYVLNEEKFRSFKDFFEQVTTNTDQCICKEGEPVCGEFCKASGH